MLNQFSRTQLLLGESAMQELANKRVAVFGIGGVGGYACEALVRSGIGAFDLIDDDKVCLTNLNRQIIATRKTVGKYKTEVMKERMLEINPNVDVRIHNCFFLPENADEFPFDEFAYYASKIDFIEEQSDEIYSVDGLLNLELNNLFTSNIRKFVPYSDIEKITLKNGNISRLVCVGRISERKNPLELIKAFSQVNINNLELVFIGNSDENVQKECQDYINKKNIKNINFVGYMENPWEYFTDKDIFVSSSSLETFGLVYVEALLNGIPTIISDNPGYRSAMKIFEIGQMYELGNVEQLTQVIKEVVSNYDFYKKNSLENLEKVQQRYSVENCYKELVESIETLPVVENKPLRHLSKLLTINPPRTVYNSYLGRVKRKVKKLLKKV